MLLGFPPSAAFLLSGGAPACSRQENVQGNSTDPVDGQTLCVSLASGACSSILLCTDVYPGDHQFQVAIINKKQEKNDEIHTNVPQ